MTTARSVFFVNEGGGTVYVVFEDGTTNNNFGVLARGATNFSLGGHTSYSIYGRQDR